MDYSTKIILRAQALLDHLVVNDIGHADQAYLRLVFNEARRSKVLDVSALESTLLGAPDSFNDPFTEGNE